MNLNSLVGLSEISAISEINSSNMIPRVVHRDGRNLIITDDIRKNRVNLHIDNGYVVKIYIG